MLLSLSCHYSLFCFIFGVFSRFRRHLYLSGHLCFYSHIFMSLLFGMFRLDYLKHICLWTIFDFSWFIIWTSSIVGVCQPWNPLIFLSFHLTTRSTILRPLTYIKNELIYHNLDILYHCILMHFLDNVDSHIISISSYLEGNAC